MVSPLLFYNKYRNLLPITPFLSALSSVRAADTMVALKAIKTFKKAAFLFTLPNIKTGDTEFISFFSVATNGSKFIDYIK